MNETIGFIVFIVIACWIIAIANWMGFEPLSNDRYEFLTLLIYICRFVVFTSLFAGAAVVAYVLLNR